MRVLHVVFGLLLFAAVFLLAAAVVYLAWSPECWGRALDLLRSERLPAMGAAAVPALLAVLFLLTGLPRRGREPFVTFENEGGSVSVSSRAIEEHIGRIGDEFAAVLDMIPSIEATRGAMAIGLDVRVRGGTQIPELCRLLQERVREAIRDSLGLTDIRGVRVRVREIVAAPREKKRVEENPV